MRAQYYTTRFLSSGRLSSSAKERRHKVPTCEKQAVETAAMGSDSSDGLLACTNSHDIMNFRSIELSSLAV